MAINFIPFDELFAPEYQLTYISMDGHIIVGPNTYSVFHSYTMTERQQIFQVCEKYLPWQYTEIQEQWERTQYMYQFIIKSPPPFSYEEYKLNKDIVMEIELLVRIADGSAGRMRGDIVSMKKLPHRGWGNGENLPNYLVIRISDITLDTAMDIYAQRHVELNPLDLKSPSKRSNYRLDLDALPKEYAKERPHLTINKNTVINNAILRAFI